MCLGIAGNEQSLLFGQGGCPFHISTPWLCFFLIQLKWSMVTQCALLSSRDVASLRHLQHAQMQHVNPAKGLGFFARSD
jgi:hypothetical protein